MMLATTTPAAMQSALLVLLGMSLAAVAHLAWLGSSLARRFSYPIDGHRLWRGKRWFGDNKQWRGLMMLPPAAALSFSSLSLLQDQLPTWLAQGFWQMPSSHYALLGFACGLGFMLAELPNSFLKRQLDVAPGQAPQHPAIAIFCALLDRLDSACGVLLACYCLVPMASLMWLWLLIFGPALHAFFSVLQFALGLKGRAL